MQTTHTYALDVVTRAHHGLICSPESSGGESNKARRLKEDNSNPRIGADVPDSAIKDAESKATSDETDYGGAFKGSFLLPRSFRTVSLLRRHETPGSVEHACKEQRSVLAEREWARCGNAFPRQLH
jgi:hypothetical protein